MSVDISKSKLVSDVLRRVKRTFGDEAGVQITTSDIFDWINDGQIEIAERQKIGRNKMSTDIESGSGWFIISFADMLSIEDIQFEGKPLPYLPLEEASSTIMQEDPYRADGDYSLVLEAITRGQPKRTGTPQFWTLDSSPMFDFDKQLAYPLLSLPENSAEMTTIYLWPVPDRSVKRGLSITFIRKPAPVDKETDLLSVPDKFFNALVQYVLTQAYELDEDHDAATIKRQEFENAMLGYMGESEDQQMRTYPKITYYDEGW